MRYNISITLEYFADDDTAGLPCCPFAARHYAHSEGHQKARRLNGVVTVVLEDSVFLETEEKLWQEGSGWLDKPTTQVS
jgi:hypothetical protein